MAIIADKILLRVNGEKLNDFYYNNFHLVQELGKPNEFRFQMGKKKHRENDEDITFVMADKLMGKKLEFVLVTIRHDEAGATKKETLEFIGIIFNARVIRSSMGASQLIEVIAYSPDHLLRDSLHCCSFESLNLQAIVKNVMKGYNIPIVNEPDITKEILYTVQYNETSYDFLNRLAVRFGAWMYWNGIQLIFGKVDKKQRVTLFSEVDILNYEYQLQMKHTNFTHASHNYLENLENTADGTSFSGSAIPHMMTDSVYENSQSAFKKKTCHDLLSSNPEDNPLDELEASAKVQALGRKAQMTICRGATNRADLMLGSVIGIRESYETAPNERSFCTHDDLLIYRIEHTATIQGFYENKFEAMPANAAYPPYDQVDLYPHATAQRAVVKDNKDPEKLGRVRVQFHWQERQGEMTPWIRIAQPHGGGNKGFYFIPEKNEEVMVGFENGNAEKPYVIGTLYHGKAKPPESWYNDEDNIKAIRTRSGHTIEFHDTEGEELIKIFDNEKDNYILTFSTHEQLIKLQSKGNIELYAEKNVIIDAKENITINAGKNIDKKAGDNISREAGKNIIEKAGDNIQVDAGKNISKSAGDNVRISAGKNMTIDAEENISESSGKDFVISVSKDSIISVSKNMSLSVGKDLDAAISKNLYTKVAEKFDLRADNLDQNIGKNINIKAGSKLEQKAKGGITIDGGSKMDVKAGNVKIN